MTTFYIGPAGGLEKCSQFIPLLAGFLSYQGCGWVAGAQGLLRALSASAAMEVTEEAGAAVSTPRLPDCDTKLL